MNALRRAQFCTAFRLPPSAADVDLVSAVRLFQRDNGLFPDGECTDETADKLGIALPAEPVLVPDPQPKTKRSP